MGIPKTGTLSCLDGAIGLDATVRSMRGNDIKIFKALMNPRPLSGLALLLSALVIGIIQHIPFLWLFFAIWGMLDTLDFIWKYIDN